MKVTVIFPLAIPPAIRLFLLVVLCFNLQLYPAIALSSEDVSPEKLNQFVTAYSGIMAAVERQEMAWQSARSEAEALRIQAEVEQSALDAIEKAGLSPTEYRQLVNLAQVDDEFGETIVALLQDFRGIAESKPSEIKK